MVLHLQFQCKHGDLASTAQLEERRREALGPSSTDDINVLVLKYRCNSPSRVQKMGSKVAALAHLELLMLARGCQDKALQWGRWLILQATCKYYITYIPKHLW